MKITHFEEKMINTSQCQSKTNCCRLEYNTRKPTSGLQAIGNPHLINEPSREKTNNVVSEQVRHKPSCTNTEES